MAASDDAKLEELKRLLRRLDKALPPSLAGETADASAEEEDRQQYVARQGKPPRAEKPGQASNATALRTVVLAGGVSMIVSWSLFALIVYEIIPLRRFATVQAPSKSDVRPIPAQMGGPSSIGAPGVPVKEQAGEAQKQHSAEVSETATLQAETSPRSLSKPDPIQKPPGEAPASAPPSDVTVAGGLSVTSPTTEAARATEAAPASAPPVSAPSTSAPQVAAIASFSEPAFAAKADEPQEAAARTGTDSQALAELDASQFLRRGLLMLSSGSVSAAQLLLERAADLGSGDAAFALASTYDGASGAPRQGSAVRPNADLALRWYGRAQELGVEKARTRLGELQAGAAARTGEVR